MTIRVTTLENGLRVVTDSMETVETVSVGSWVEVGTRQEDAAINGVSHMLEHMAFKGTKRRSAQAIAEDIEAVGGHLNAYTSRETTAYYAKVLKEDLPLAVDMIGDILQNSVMDEEELARERTVILQEIHQANDTPDDIIFDRFQETAFPGQALGRPVLGTAELVGGMSRDTLMGYMKGHYSAPRMVLAAAGRVDHDRFVDLVTGNFAFLPPYVERSGESFDYKGGDYRESRDLEQMHLLLGFQGVSYTDPDYYPSLILSTLLGGGMSSRLFQEVREKRGLAYSVYSYASSYTDGGTFGIYAGTSEGEVAELVPVICGELEKVCERVEGVEIDRARAQLKASLLMSLESTSSRCEQKARQMMVYGRLVPIEEVVEKIGAVDAASVVAVAHRIIASRPTVAAIGPVGTLESYDAIAARLS
ncbi:MAG: insulinase family protein [Rhodospirillales bacterium]|nr:insulinase family protein [Rhodospirillales bacterium]MCW8951972.1 insulinase family protein [Rhodospirillales bacterium]MCW8971584.1 insulinase family protein [Rhodospirillales bacterium]MCW9002380.1 insulinase family protein [Rhodospirillales bacterium]MCW9040264.1 insulinase family protein [Rhodospirillales bacterium]